MCIRDSILGSLWAYHVLGWGGYWGWDPVENAGILPWFTATAFLHSLMIQERRGMMKIWNVVLVIMTFLLTMVGTFMTRSGIVQSVHAFGNDPELAARFLAFIGFAAVFSFGYVIYRLPLLLSLIHISASRSPAVSPSRRALRRHLCPPSPNTPLAGYLPGGGLLFLASSLDSMKMQGQRCCVSSNLT